MSTSTTRSIIAIFLSIVLLLWGFYFYGSIIDFLLPEVEGGRFQIDFTETFIRSLTFSLSLALIPIIILLSWKFYPIVVKQKRMISVLIVVACSILGVFIRYFMIKSYLISFAKGLYYIPFPMAELHYDYYLLGGLFSGAIICYLLLREKKYNQHNQSAMGVSGNANE